jgi:hypothetical protein
MRRAKILAAGGPIWCNSNPLAQSLLRCDTFIKEG